MPHQHPHQECISTCSPTGTLDPHSSHTLPPHVGNLPLKQIIDHPRLRHSNGLMRETHVEFALLASACVSPSQRLHKELELLSIATGSLDPPLLSKGFGP